MFNMRSVYNVNKRIGRIKEAGLQPITLKSPADLIEKFIHERGTSKEGLFKTYAEYVREYGYIDRELYYNIIEDFFNVYENQLNVKGAMKYAAQRARHLLEDRYNNLDIDFDVEEISERELVDIVSKAGRETNERVKNGETSDIFYYLLEKYMDELYNTAY